MKKSTMRKKGRKMKKHFIVKYQYLIAIVVSLLASLIVSPPAFGADARMHATGPVYSGPSFKTPVDTIEKGTRVVTLETRPSTAWPNSNYKWVLIGYEKNGQVKTGWVHVEPIVNATIQ